MFETQKHRSSSNIVAILDELRIDVDSLASSSLASTSLKTIMKNPAYEDQTS